MNEQLGRFVANALGKLKTSPDEQSWSLVLYGSAAGLLDKELELLGSIDQFVYTTHANSMEPVLSRASFAQALDKFVDDWQPAELATYRTHSTLLTLIAAYTPKQGFTKILGQLVHWGVFSTSHPIAGNDSQDLCLKALKALEKYCPVYPLRPEDLPGFPTYAKFLEKIVGDGSLKGYVLKRLLELNIWSVEQPSVRQFIHNHYEEILPEMVHWIESGDLLSLREIVNVLFDESYESEERHYLLCNELTNIGASITDDISEPYITLSNGSKLLAAPVDDTRMLQYMEIRWNDSPRSQESIDQLVLEKG